MMTMVIMHLTKELEIIFRTCYWGWAIYKIISISSWCVPRSMTKLTHEFREKLQLQFKKVQLEKMSSCESFIFCALSLGFNEYVCSKDSLCFV